MFYYVGQIDPPPGRDKVENCPVEIGLMQKNMSRPVNLADPKSQRLRLHRIKSLGSNNGSTSTATTLTLHQSL